MIIIIGTVAVGGFCYVLYMYFDDDGNGTAGNFKGGLN